MASSMTSSPTIHAPIPMRSSSATPTKGPLVNQQWQSWSGQKRRPIDPEETGTAATTPYDCEQPRAKRARTIDDVLGMLSLQSSDPPAHSFCSKRKSDGDDGAVGNDNNGRSPKMARSSASTSRASTFDENRTADGNGLEPAGRKDSSPTNVASELFDSSAQSPMNQHDNDTSYAQPRPETSVSGNDVMGNNDNEMSIEDSSGHESDHSSVSEGSIRNAMYQLVFGKNKNNPQPPLSTGIGGHGKYDAVDSKIEDLIRRSRLEAAIKSQKENCRGDKEVNDDMDMDMDGGNSEEDEEWYQDGDEWHPGHG